MPSFLCHFQQHNHVGVFPTRALPSGPVHMISIQVADQKDRQPTAEKGGQFRSNQKVGGRKVSPKKFHRPVGRCLQVGQARNGTEWWATLRRTNMALPPPAIGLCGGRHKRIKECLTSEAYIDSVFVQKVLQFNFPAQQSLHIPAGQRKTVPHFFFLGRAAVFSHKEDDRF